MDAALPIFIMLLVVGALLVLPAVIVFNVAKDAVHPYVKWLRFTVFPTKDHPEFFYYNNALQYKFPYFHLLTEPEKHVFIARIAYIRKNKKFTGRGIDVTEEMEIFISAAIAQLTFGLSEFDIAGFNDIHITPESFYSRLVGSQVKGLTFKSGRVMLSWHDFKEGYFITNDKLNLALHELAHALSLDRTTILEVDEDLRSWERIAIRELHKLRTNTDSQFLRDYAATDMHELWACCVESFFEAPLEFQEHIPDLYQRMAVVLNQDMAGRMRDRQHLLSAPLNMA